MKPEPLDLKEIEREIEYEWNDEATSYLQKKLEYWVGCYEGEKHAVFFSNFIGKDVVILPLSVKEDVWCDIFTDVVKTIKKRVMKKIKQQIKSACEFYLRYKDNPELLIKEHPKCEDEVVSMCFAGWDDYYRRNLIVTTEYNEWLFKLAFKDVLGDKK